jgi:hypothetical protein
MRAYQRIGNPLHTNSGVIQPANDAPAAWLQLAELCGLALPRSTAGRQPDQVLGPLDWAKVRAPLLADGVGGRIFGVTIAHDFRLLATGNRCRLPDDRLATARCG